MSFIVSIGADVESVQSTLQSTPTTLSIQINKFKSRYGVALSDPLGHSRKLNKPVLYLIYAPWSNTYQVFDRDSMNDPIIFEYMNLFEVIKIRGDMDQYKKMLPKRYWTRQYPALIAFSESRELGYLRGEDTVDTERLYKSLDFWFEQWRKDKETISGNKPVHPMRYFYEEDYKSRESVTSKRGFLLKTGWIVHGKPIEIRNKIVTMVDNQSETYLPLHLFTDHSRELVKNQAFASMKESASLIPGDFPLNFSNKVDSIPSINAVKDKSNLPVLVLLDPEESFLDKVKRYNIDNRKTANTLTYVKKYIAGKSLAKQMADIIATFYKVEYPAILVLKAGTENRSFSNLGDPEELYQIINDEDLIREITPLKDENNDEEQNTN